MTLIRKIAWKIWKIVKYTFVLLGFCAICIIIWIGFSLVYNKVETYAPFGWHDNFDDCQLALQQRDRYTDNVTEIDERYFLAWTNYGSDDGYSARLCDSQGRRQSWSFTARYMATVSGSLVAIPYYNSCGVRIIQLHLARRETYLPASGCHGRIEHLVWDRDLLAVFMRDGFIEVWDVSKRRLIDTARGNSINNDDITFTDGVIRIGYQQIIVDTGD